MANGEDFLLSLGEMLRYKVANPDINSYRPHDKQIDFHSSNAKTRLYIGGNRSGKSYGNISECIYWLTKNHPYRRIPVGEYEPTRGRINTVDFVNGAEKIILPLLKQLIPPSFLIDGAWEKSYNKHLRVLTLNNGSFVEILSYESDLDKFAGTSRHFISYDEEPPEVIYTENLARLIDTGGHQWMSLTPVEGMSWIYDKIYLMGRSGDPNYHNTEISMEENPYLNQEEVRSFLQGLSEDERKARGEGKFVEFGGLIYKDFQALLGGKHVVDLGAEFRPGKSLPVGISLDHGFNNPTAVLWHAILPEGRILVFHEHYLSGETVSYHAREIREYNKRMGIEPVILIADPSIKNTDPITGTSILQEYIKYGLPFTPANNDVRAGIERVNKYFKPRAGGDPMLKIDKSCVNLIKELSRYKWKTYTSKKLNARYNAWEEPHKLHDHACDALRYFIMSRPDLDTMFMDINHKKDRTEYAFDTVTALNNDFTVRQLKEEEYRSFMGRNSDYTDTEGDLMGGIW